MRTSRTRWLTARLPARALVLLVVMVFPACQQQMAKQPSYRPDEPSAFFPDGRSARPPVPGAVARGQLQTDTHLFTGVHPPAGGLPDGTGSLIRAGGAGLEPRTTKNPVDLSTEESNAVDSFPFPVTEKVLKHGQNRYLIYCVVCHDALGTGHGIIVQRGYTPPPSFHRERLRKVPAGHIFEVITKGYGSMPMYRAQIPPRDRWAIVAYVRALQLSQHFPVKDLPADLRRQWEAQKTGGGGE